MQIAKEFNSASEQAINQIVEITGEKASVLKMRYGMFLNDILPHLSYLIQANQEQQELTHISSEHSNEASYWKHNSYYKAATKGIVSTKYKAFGTDKKIHDFLKFFSARLNDMAFRRVYGNTTAANLSNPFASVGNSPAIRSHAPQSLPKLYFPEPITQVTLATKVLNAGGASPTTGRL